MSTSTVDKTLYKIFLSAIKFIPSALACIQILNLILSYFKSVSFFLTCIGGTSFIFLGLLYILSYLFQFCGTHRISLHYITLITSLTTFDWYIGIPIDLSMKFLIYGIVTGVFILTWLIFWYTNRKNPKIDYIKNLCESYCNC